jgi:lysyl-tRNA synthetase class 2
MKRDPLDAEWRPGADLRALRARAEMLAGLRRYFAEYGVLEVETPLACHAAGTDPAIATMQAHYRGPVYPDGTSLYLQSSPEFAMKRLLAAGSGPIFQVCKAFRDGEAGRLHNPEFTILEWYRPGWDLPRLIDETVAVVRQGLASHDLECRRNDYAALFASLLDVDVFSSDTKVLQTVALDHHVLGAEGMMLDRDGWLDLLFSHLIQPKLGGEQLCVVTDYPASQAALARLNPDGLTAARFELFYRGVELANGFHELTDPDEQAARFEADNCSRRAAGLVPVRVDRRLLAAMQHGLPDCAGVALGLDRLLMLRLGRDSLDEVLSFSLQRA